MKRLISSTEYIEAMSTIGQHFKPNFMIAVNPADNRSGDCYFKYFNRESYSKADAVARIDMRSPKRFYHMNQDGKVEWDLSAKDKKELCKYLDAESDDWTGVTNWQSVLFNWNRECHLLSEPFPRDQYTSRIEAFLNGFYDTDDNLSNPSYVASYLSRPDYTKLPNR